MSLAFSENGSSLYSSIDESAAVVSASINIILGLPLNVYVMWLILAGTRETLASDFFSLNMAVCEMFFSLSVMWYLVYKLQQSHFYLKAYMFSLGLLFTGRPLLQCCICVECYVGVVHPVLFLQLKPLRYRVACCCVVWLSVLISCIYSLNTFLNSLYLYGYFVQNILFLFVTLFCNISVLRALKHKGPGEKATEKKRSNALKRRAFKIILLITISMNVNFFLSVAPVPLQCCVEGIVFSKALIVCFSLALTIGFIHPLLYLIRTRKLLCFRED